MKSNLRPGGGGFYGGRFFTPSPRYFLQVADERALIFGAKNFEKKTRNPFFYAFRAKIRLKNFFEKNFPRGGALIFGGLENKNLRPPLPINNEPSLNSQTRNSCGQMMGSECQNLQTGSIDKSSAGSRNRPHLCC